MADRRSLGIVGFCFGGVTAAVMLVAVMTVKNHVDSRIMVQDAGLPKMASVQVVMR